MRNFLYPGLCEYATKVVVRIRYFGEFFAASDFVMTCGVVLQVRANSKNENVIRDIPRIPHYFSRNNRYCYHDTIGDYLHDFKAGM